ncbi:Zinc finger MYND domain-containing protein 19 isoform X3 [Mycena sanguinolenta]|uniref:Zinc finger MYND domain-containing protein 19 isoform X3 n=1 Tax=Mycena sanguinolenta TaxID=230812 RepID=A0A8H6ZFI3_9AGAR|nr:Zinc finger MYND domain-containing protein 19 isoform X3 [Mycena sanguinolenta]
MMLRSWDEGVWKWMLFLYNSGTDLNDTIANEGRPLLLTRPVITVGIVDALVGCADSVPLGNRLILVPDVVSLIVRLWVEDLEIPGRPNMVHNELTFVMYHIVNDSQNDSTFSTLVGAVNGAETVMRSATNRFRRLVSSTNSKEMESQLAFIDLLAENPMLRDAMHEVDALSVTLTAIDALTKQSNQIDACRALESCIDIMLLKHLLSGPNVKPLIHSINKGLLRTLYDARVAFGSNEECCEVLAEVIILVIGPSLIFRSVLHAVERAELKTGVFAAYRSAEHEFHEWETLTEVYQDMIQFKHEVDEELVHCGFLNCPTSDVRVKFHRCGRCQYKKYCSKECQQQDWPKHKRQCHKESANEITPVSDREFARDRAEFEVRMNIRSLFERVQKNPALQTTQDLMFQVDFTTLDRNISIGVAPFAPSPHEERRAAIYAKVQSGREAIQSLGLVTGWKELQRSSQPENILFPDKFRKLIIE